jgi:transposase
MDSAQHRHDISDHVWELLEPHLPGRKGTWGGKARDNRQFINVIFWILRTGAPWRDLPPSYGDWKNTHRRFCRWRDKGIWSSLLERLMDEPDYEWLMIDASHVKAHSHASGARGGNQGIGLRSCLQSFQQEAQKGEMYELQAGIEQTFKVFPQSSGLLKPAKGTFDNPTLRHDRKSMQRIAFGRPRFRPQFFPHSTSKGRSTIAAISQQRSIR